MMSQMPLGTQPSQKRFNNKDVNKRLNSHMRRSQSRANMSQKNRMYMSYGMNSSIKNSLSLFWADF